MASILQQVGTPLQLVALFLILVAGVARLLVRSGTSKESTPLKRLVINRIFAAALVALIIGTLAGLAGPVLDRLVNGDEIFHGVVLSTTGDPVPDATINLMTIASVPTNAAGQVDINVPRSRVRKEYTVQVRAIGFQTSDVLTRSDSQMRNFAIRLTPAPEEVVKSLEPSLIVGQYFGAPIVLAVFRVENSGSSPVAISDIRGTLTGTKGTILVTPVVWTIVNSYGPFAPVVGPFPIMGGARLDLRVALSTGVDFSALEAATAALPEYQTERPCTPKPPNGAMAPITSAGFRIARNFAEQHFAWYAGAWKLQIDVISDREHKTFTRDFVLSAAEVAALRDSIALIKQCRSINVTLPFAQDGALANFVPK